MADIRALLAQERQARRVNHPHASYSKSNVLTCSVCHLNIKSEALWEGHLRSANHRKNAQRSLESTPKSTKRKIGEVEEAPTEDRGYEVDSRKKPKSKTVKFVDEPEILEEEAAVLEDPPEVHINTIDVSDKQHTEALSSNTAGEQHSNEDRTTHDTVPSTDIDEDEWAAFERDMASLKQPDYTAATIVAAPVSTAQMQEEAATEKKKLRDIEGEEEKEDESRRMEDEFDVMEEMEERVRALREKREALRSLNRTEADTGQEQIGEGLEDTNTEKEQEITTNRNSEEEEEDEDDDVDDWYS